MRVELEILSFPGEEDWLKVLLSELDLLAILVQYVSFLEEITVHQDVRVAS